MVEPSKELQLVFEKAIKDAQKLKHEYVTIEHLCLQCFVKKICPKTIPRVWCRSRIFKEQFRAHLSKNCDELVITLDKYKPKKTGAVERVLNLAFTLVLFSGRSNIELPRCVIEYTCREKSN